jgi:hypothetical protein
LRTQANSQFAMLFLALLLPLVLAQRTPMMPMSVEQNPMVNDGSCGTQREMCMRMENKCSKEWIMCMFGGRCTPQEHPQPMHARKCKEFVRTSCSESMQPELEEACVFHTMGITVIGVDEVGCTQQVQSSGEEMTRRMTGPESVQFLCSPERVRSLYGNRCRARMPIHQLHNSESCKREFRNLCPFDRREPTMRMCEMETGIVSHEWLSQPNMWPTWLTNPQQQYNTPYYTTSPYRSYSSYQTFSPYYQKTYGSEQTSMNPSYYPFWMTSTSNYYNPWSQTQQQSNPWTTQGMTDPMCDRLVRRMCMIKPEYGQTYGQTYGPMTNGQIYGQTYGSMKYGQMYGQGMQQQTPQQYDENTVN